MIRKINKISKSFINKNNGNYIIVNKQIAEILQIIQKSNETPDNNSRPI
jgi:hypothetical protein